MPVYDDLTGDTTEQISYVVGASNPDLYPDSNTIAILGPVWAPRIYGKDLTAFEIASSGKIALSINDVHSIDISRTAYITGVNWKNTMNAESNFSLELLANDNKLQMMMDSYSNEIRINAPSNIRMQTSNYYLDTWENTTIVSQSNLVLTSENWNIISTAYNSFTLESEKSNLSLKASSNSFDIFAYSNVLISTSNNMVVTSSNNISFSNLGSNFSVSSASNVTMVAKEGVFSLTAHSNELQTFSWSNTTISTSNNLVVQSSNMITFSNLGSNFAVSSASNVTMVAKEGVFSLTAHSNELQTFSWSNTTISTSNNLVVQSSNMITFSNLGSNFGVSSASNVTMVAKEGVLSLTAHSNQLSVFGWSNVTVSTSNDMYIYSSNMMTLCNLASNLNVSSASNITALANNGNVLVKAGLNITLSNSLSNIGLFAYSNANLETEKGDLSLVAHSNNIRLTTGSNIIGIADSNINLTSKYDSSYSASNNLYLTASNDASLQAKFRLDIQASNINMTSLYDTTITAQSNVFFKINSSPDDPNQPVFTVAGNLVKVRGDMLITGTINTSNIINTTVVQETLKISDRTILLASVGAGDSNDFTPIDGLATNDKSGVVIDGYPTGYDSNVPEAYQKALLWNYGTAGLDDIGTVGGAGTESYWEVLGGALRLTRRKIDGGQLRELSFGFRMNNFDELELYKRFWSAPANSYVIERVCRFGRILPV